MKKYIFALILVAASMFCHTVFATERQADEAMNAAAVRLNKLGWLSGKGVKADGSTDFGLGNVTNRAEAYTVMVRIMGKEAEATGRTWAHPFSDVPSWAENAVGYTYNNGLTSGVTATEFGSMQVMTAQQFATLMLRALGYTDSDFSDATSLQDAVKLGVLTQAQVDSAKQQFTRGDLAIFSDAFLKSAPKGSEYTVAKQLLDNGVIAAAQYKEAYAISAATGTASAATAVPQVEIYLSRDKYARNNEKSLKTYDKALAIISEIITKDMSDFKKEKAVYEYIVRNVKYDTVAARKVGALGTGDASIAYGAIVNNRAICSGYARAMKLFMDMLGIECRYITNIFTGDEGHAWNMVKLDDDWYHVDATWGRKDAEFVLYEYFNLPDSVISRERIHQWKRESYPAATSEKYYYYAMERNRIMEWYNSLTLINTIEQANRIVDNEKYYIMIEDGDLWKGKGIDSFQRIALFVDKAIQYSGVKVYVVDHPAIAIDANGYRKEINIINHDEHSFGMFWYKSLNNVLGNKSKSSLGHDVWMPINGGTRYLFQTKMYSPYVTLDKQIDEVFNMVLQQK